MSSEDQPTHFDSGSTQETGPIPQNGEVCIPNISTAERRKRLAFGALTFGISLAALAMLVATGVSRW